MSRVRIESDGTPYGTRVFNKDGTEIPLVTEIDWHLSMDGLATARITLFNVEIVAMGDAE